LGFDEGSDAGRGSAGAAFGEEKAKFGVCAGPFSEAEGWTNGLGSSKFDPVEGDGTESKTPSLGKREGLLEIAADDPEKENAVLCADLG